MHILAKLGRTVRASFYCVHPSRIIGKVNMMVRLGKRIKYRS